MSILTSFHLRKKNLKFKFLISMNAHLTLRKTMLFRGATKRYFRTRSTPDHVNTVTQQCQSLHVPLGRARMWWYECRKPTADLPSSVLIRRNPTARVSHSYLLLYNRLRVSMEKKATKFAKDMWRKSKITWVTYSRLCQRGWKLWNCKTFIRVGRRIARRNRTCSCPRYPRRAHSVLVGSC